VSCSQANLVQNELGEIKKSYPERQTSRPHRKASQKPRLNSCPEEHERDKYPQKDDTDPDDSDDCDWVLIHLKLDSVSWPNDQAQRPPPETPGRLQQSRTNYLNRPTAQRGGGSLQRPG
jgi:hypothetical protein